MRTAILGFLRNHPRILNCSWGLARIIISFVGLFVPVRKKTILFASFGGRNFDDSPKALYDEIISRPEFDDWELIWAFVEPENIEIPRGRKIRIDTPAFFKALLYSRVWISNSGMDRNIELKRKGTIKIETWHGTPFKKICEDQNSGTLGNYQYHGPVDTRTIRCAQSEYDRSIFVRVFHASEDSFLMSDLPRNDGLLKYLPEGLSEIRRKLHIPEEKKVLLYMPTFREYLIDDRGKIFLTPPMDLAKWEQELGNEYVLLIRAHYAVSAAMNIQENEFVRDVTRYPSINDLYAVADILISDYSSAYIDYSILDRPMLCFAYDEKEYLEKRGLYIDLHKELPCPIDNDETQIIHRIKTMDYAKESEATRLFHMKYAPYAGNASKVVIDTLIERLRKQ